MTVLSHIKKRSHEIKRDVIAIRQHIHAHPELSFNELETSEYIHAVLKRLKIASIKKYSGFSMSPIKDERTERANAKDIDDDRFLRLFNWH